MIEAGVRVASKRNEIPHALLMLIEQKLCACILIKFKHSISNTFAWIENPHEWKHMYLQQNDLVEKNDETYNFTINH